MGLHAYKPPTRGSSQGGRYSQLGATPSGARRQRRGSVKTQPWALSSPQNPPTDTRREGPGGRQSLTPKVCNARWEWKQIFYCADSTQTHFSMCEGRGFHASGSVSPRASHPLTCPQFVHGGPQRLQQRKRPPVGNTGGLLTLLNALDVGRGPRGRVFHMRRRYHFRVPGNFPGKRNTTKAVIRVRWGFVVAVRSQIATHHRAGQTI